MEKITKAVPAGVKYLSTWLDFDLLDCPHILDKQLTGCGFTEWCIKSDKNIILCSPRRILLENKEEQHPDEVLYVKNDSEKLLGIDKDLNVTKASPVTYHMDDNSIKEGNAIHIALKAEIKNWWIARKLAGKSCKYLITYDSYRILKEALEELGVLDQFYVVVDEFQSIFTDSRFKSSTEMEFLNHLKGIQHLCFASATPMMDEYLEMLDEFKNLPFVELDWETEDPSRISKADLVVKSTKSITTSALEIIKSYKSGLFEKTVILDDSGFKVEIESREVVFYVNSVKNIITIIGKAGLNPDEVNILCAKTPENEKKLKRSLGMRIGKVPLEGQPHKMFTFCTRTVYLGADFYSTCAKTVVLSDANIDSLVVDISMDLPQILGRQRLNENPWRNRATLYIKLLSSLNKMTGEDFKNIITQKKKRSDSLLRAYNTAISEDKHSLAENYQKVAKSYNYKDDYVAVNTHGGKDMFPVFNNLVMIAELRAFQIQQIDYADRLKVYSRIKNEGMNLCGVPGSKDFSFISKFNMLSQFPDKMKLLCESDLDNDVLLSVLEQVPIEYKTYYLAFGPERLRATGYQKYRLDKEYNKSVYDINERRDKIYSEFKVGDKISLSEIKQRLSNIYSGIEYSGSPKATDLLDYFEIKEIKVYQEIDGSKKRVKAYELLSTKK